MLGCCTDMAGVNIRPDEIIIAKRIVRNDRAKLPHVFGAEPLCERRLAGERSSDNDLMHGLEVAAARIAGAAAVPSSAAVIAAAVVAAIISGAGFHAVTRRGGRSIGFA